jgi:hypothetical protein
VSRSDLPESEDGQDAVQKEPAEPADEPTATEADNLAADTPAEAGIPAEPVAGRRSILLISAAAVVVLAVIGVAIYLLVSDDSSDETAARPVPTIQDSGAAGATTSTTTPPAGPTSSLTVPPSTGASTEIAGGEAGDAQSVAEQAASAISSADTSTLSQLSCDPSTAGGEDTFPAGAKAEVVGEPKISGDTATIDVRLTFAGAEPAVVPMPLTRQNGRWCIL